MGRQDWGAALCCQPVPRSLPVAFWGCRLNARHGRVGLSCGREDSYCSWSLLARSRRAMSIAAHKAQSRDCLLGHQLGRCEAGRLDHGLTRSNLRLYAGMSGENSTLAKLETGSRVLIAAQESSRGTWRLFCGINAHGLFCFSCASLSVAY
jgi:hypothetical protein